MTNFEKYEEEIKKILEKGNDFAVNKEGRVQICGSGTCTACIFNKPGICSNLRLKWLFEEAENTREKAIKEITHDYLEMCHKYKKCDECPYYNIAVSKVHCAIAFTYDYLKENGGAENGQ